jgi:hypothetical protein
MTSSIEGAEYSTRGTMSVVTTKNGGLLLETPANDFVRLKKLSIKSTFAITVSLLEDYIETEGNTLARLPGIDRNRNANRTAKAVAQGCVDITPVNGPNALTLATVALVPNLEVDVSGEWILKPGTNYMLAIANASGSTAAIGYDLVWEELSTL